MNNYSQADMAFKKLIDSMKQDGNTHPTIEEMAKAFDSIIQTRKGDIPLHRGIGLTGNWIDKPITVAPTLMVTDLKEAIEEGEPRAEFVQATFEIDPNDPAHLIPTVEVNIRDE